MRRDGTAVYGRVQDGVRLGGWTNERGRGLSICWPVVRPGRLQLSISLDVPELNYFGTRVWGRQMKGEGVGCIYIERLL